jgi:HAD superfamily hydrolase (TIGR01549 family)
MAQGANDFSGLQSLPQAVLFDLDNTLYRYDVCHAAGLAASVSLLSNRYPWEPAAIEAAYLCGRAVVHERLHGRAASHSRLLYFQSMLEAEGAGSDLRSALDADAAYWCEYFEAMELFPGVAATLERLQARGVKAGIVTDLTADIQFKKIVALGLANLIDCIVTSEEAGAEKPASTLFRLALDKLEIGNPGGCWMVGDSVDRDIAGAHRLGMTTLHRVEEGAEDSGQATCVFDSFERLLSFLETL